MDKKYGVKSTLRMLGFIFLVAALGTTAVFISGCEQVDKESIDRIIQGDPQFKGILDKKEELDSKIALLSQQLEEAKAAAYANIRNIQDNFNKQKEEIYSKINSFKRELDPARLKIKEGIEDFNDKIAVKKDILKNLENTRRNLSNLISQQKAVNVTAEDMSKWQERLIDLDKQIEPIKGELRELEEELKSLRVKLVALRQ